VLEKYSRHPFVLQSVDDSTSEVYAKCGFMETTKAALWTRMQDASWPVPVEKQRRDIARGWNISRDDAKSVYGDARSLYKQARP